MLKNYVFTVCILLLKITLFAQNIPSYVPKDGLVGWWPFNGNTNDESGNGYDLDTMSFKRTFDSDRNGNLKSALVFDRGQKLYFRVRNSEKFDLGANLFTVSIWIKYDSTYSFDSYGSDLSIFLKGYNSFNFGLDDKSSSGIPNSRKKFGLGFGKGYGIYPDIVPKIGWNHIVCVKTNIGYSYFVNGVKYNLPFNPYNQSVSDLNQTLTLGYGAIGYFNGLMDNFTLYNRSLTEQEVGQLYTEKPYCSNISPVISLIGKNTFCDGDTTILKTNTFKNAKYQWYKDGIKIPNANDSIYVSKQSGNYAVGVFNDSVCESRSSATNVKVYHKPISVKINENATTLCEGETVLLITENNEGYRFQWKKYGNYITGATNSTLSVNSPGEYSVITYSYCNDSIESRSIVVNYKSIPSSNLLVEGKTSFCFGDSVKLKLDKKYTNNLQWFNGSSAISGATDSIYYAKKSGNYSVRLLDGRCFKNSSQQNISVELQEPKLNFSKTSICEGDTASAFVGESNLSWGYNGVNSYTWYFNNQEVVGSSSTNLYMLNIDKAGVYKVKLTSTNCIVFTDSIKIKILPLIANLEYSSINGNLIGETPFSVSFHTNSNATSVIWNFGDGSSSYNKSDKHTFFSSKKDTTLYNVQLINSDDECKIVQIKVLKSSKKQLLSFGLQSPPSVTYFTGADSTDIIVFVPMGTNLSNLCANFTSSPNSVVKVNGVVQQSGITLNNFTKTVKYEVVAEDGSSKIYFVTVEIKSTACDITAFGFTTPSVAGVINGTNISLTVPIGTNVQNLIAQFTTSVGATVKVGNTYQVSGQTANDFTNPVIYNVTAEDGVTTKPYIVIVTIQPAPKSTACDLTSFSLTTPSVTGKITGTTISLTVPVETNVQNLIANFSSSPYSTVKLNGIVQQSGITANNFTDTLKYEVVAEDGSSKIYFVKVNNGFGLDGSPCLTSSKLEIRLYDSPSNQNQYNLSMFSINSEIQENAGCGVIPALHVVVIDPKTFKPWETHYLTQNPQNSFGNLNDDGKCRPRTERFFIFNQNNPAQMAALQDMVTNKVPNGHYLIIYSHRFAEYQYWNSTTTSLFQTFKDLGSDSIIPGRENRGFIFFTRKGDKSSVNERIAKFKNEYLSILKTIYTNEKSNQLPDFKATISSVEPTGIHTTICNGSVGVKAEGGQAPYSYVWNNGVKTAAITEVCQGEYQVTVTDKNNCSISLNAKVAVDSTKNACNGFYAKVVSVKDDNGSCTGEIQTQTFGGKLPYSYKWNTSSTNSTLTKACKGVYILEVMDANKCSFTIEKEVKSTAVINPCKDFFAVVSELKEDLSEASCNGKIVVQAKGGKSPYTYSWENGDTTSILENKCAGSYSATIIDANNCKVTLATSISKIQPKSVNLEAEITTKDASSAQTCDGSMSINVTSGTAPYTFSHSNGETGNQRSSLCSGVYTVTVKDAKGNDQTLNYVISNPVNTIQTIVNTLKDSVSIDTLKTQLQNECSIAYDAIDSVNIKEIVLTSKDSILVTWSVYSKDKQTYVSKKYSVNKGSGVYTLILSMYCKKLKGIGSYFTVNQKAYVKLGGETPTMGIALNEVQSRMKVWPNPFAEKVKVSMDEVSDYQVSLLDISGKRVYNQEFNQTNLIELDFGQLSAGEYILKVLNKEDVQIRKISKFE